MTYVQSLVPKMEVLLVSYQRVGMSRNEGEGFTTGRDPTGGVFEAKQFLLKNFLFKYLTFFNKDIEIYFLKENAFIKQKTTLRAYHHISMH